MGRFAGVEVMTVEANPPERSLLEHSEKGDAGMMPLYLARIEGLGRGDFVKVDCAACDHVALLAPDFLLQLGLSPRTKVLDLTGRVRCRGCGARGRAVVSVKWGRQTG
jgi:ribosomal protein S27E